MNPQLTQYARQLRLSGLLASLELRLQDAGPQADRHRKEQGQRDRRDAALGEGLANLLGLDPLHEPQLQLIAAGGNIYYLAKFAGMFGLSVQDIGAQQTGMTTDAFKEMLSRAGRA